MSTKYLSVHQKISYLYTFHLDRCNIDISNWHQLNNKISLLLSAYHINPQWSHGWQVNASVRWYANHWLSDVIAQIYQANNKLINQQSKSNSWHLTNWQLYLTPRVLFLGQTTRCWNRDCTYVVLHCLVCHRCVYVSVHGLSVWREGLEW